MKNVIYYGLCLVLSLILSCTGSSQAPKTLTFTKDMLVNKDFRYQTGLLGIGVINYSEDNTYTYQFTLGALVETLCGTYEIQDNKVIMTHKKCVNGDGETVECKEGNKNMEAFIVEDLNDIMYSKFLVIKNDSIVRCPIEDSKVEAGAKRIYDNMPVITMGEKVVNITKSTWLKEKPSVSSKSVGEDEISEGTSMTITVLARSEKTEKINGADCYWYLVNAEMPYQYLFSKVWIPSNCVEYIGSQSSNQTVSLTKEILLNHKFEYSDNVCGGSIKFSEDNTYTYGFGCEGDESVSSYCGTYEITDNKVILTHTKCVDGEGRTVEFEKKEYIKEVTIIEDMNDVSYSKYLVVTNNPKYRFPLEETKVEAGEKKTFENIPVITMGNKAVKLTRTTSAKAKPSVSSADKLDSNSMQDIESIQAIARTENIENINGEDCYWYLVTVALGNGYTIDNVWIPSNCVK